ncbi:MAG TPA: DUF2892 domain-containing protein [Candidatus Aminicenantes bacterium]|nr:DUF2892 domain-containing protein [Candidatus Aminicenantes bacterium]
MKKNMGRLDRTLRLVAAAAIALLLLGGAIEGTLAVALAILAAVFVITAFVGFCPLYVPLGLSTGGKGGAPRADG